ncbi:MAG TPA: hypothetical protein VIM52_05625 [Stellaceae bacterium]|jgi:hypothetical protein
MPARLIPNAPPLPSPVTIGDLIDLANHVPPSQVIPLLLAFFPRVEELSRSPDVAGFHRHLVVLGALLNRTIFELCDLPKDRSAEI